MKYTRPVNQSDHDKYGTIPGAKPDTSSISSRSILKRMKVAQRHSNWVPINHGHFPMTGRVQLPMNTSKYTPHQGTQERARRHAAQAKAKRAIVGEGHD